MAEPPQEHDTSPLEEAKAAATQVGAGEWQMDEITLEEFEAEPVVEPVVDALPLPTVATPAPREEVPPPSPEQLIEAILFIGGQPLTADLACKAIRGLTAEHFHEAIESLNRRYLAQARPYAIQAREHGYVLAVHAKYRSLREGLFGGPREARLGQAALDVLSAIAYRQPMGKAEVDALRGTDSGGAIRQLVRLGLIAVQHRAEATGREVRYGTTARFLKVFGLTSLEELPRLGETQSAS